MPRLVPDNAMNVPLDELEAVLTEQRRITTALAGLIERQQRCVESDHAIGLLTLLGERQELVDRLMASQQELSRALAAAEPALRGADAVRKRRIEGSLAEIQARLSEVMDRDAKDQAQLQQRRGAARDEMGRIDVVHKANTAYARASNRSNRYADHKG